MIAAKNKILESALRSLLKLDSPDDEIFVTADSIGFFEKLSRLDLDLILLDWDFFNSETGDLIKMVKNDYPGTNLICMDIHHENIKNAFEACADAFYFKSDPPGELIKMIRDFRCRK